MIEIAISCDMSHTLGQRMNPDPKQKRERFQQLTQNPKVKIGKVFAADLRKSKIHPTVKKLTAWRKLNQLSQRKAVAVLAQYYFHATFPSLRSWEEGRRSPNSHTAAILEKFLLDHPTVESPKKLKPAR
jgi:DNA-binding transcriptional regulator YiaG